MNSILKITLICFIISSFIGCIVRKDPNWSDYSDNEKLDSNQIKHKEFCIKFFDAFDQGKVKKLKLMSCDTVYCEWEVGLDSIQKWNNSPLLLDTFITNYYPKLPKAWSYKGLHSTDELEKSKEMNIPFTGLILKFGPEKCFDKCDYPTFEFKKINGEYKFYRMWQY